MKEESMSATIGWLTIGCLAANLALLAVNGINYHRASTALRQATASSERYHDLMAALPPHPCGSVILPGEVCSQTFELRLPVERSY
jgi:hypothetical protein